MIYYLNRTPNQNPTRHQDELVFKFADLLTRSTSTPERTPEIKQWEISARAELSQAVHVIVEVFAYSFETRIEMGIKLYHPNIDDVESAKKFSDDIACGASALQAIEAELLGMGYEKIREA